MQTPRRQQILELLQTRGESSVAELSRELGVSDMTVRRDLQILAEEGRVLRTHGGAAPVEQVMFEFQFLRRAQERQPEKRQIGRRAAELVGDGQSVILDSGTTTLALASHLRSRRQLTVITTSLPIAAVLQRAPGVDLLLLGGFLRRQSPDLEGPLTESNLEHLRADLAFIGADGIDLNGDVYNASMGVARMLEKVVASAGDTYVVADSIKIGRTALARFGNLSRWKGLITDAGLSPEHAAALRQAGVNVIVATGQEQQDSSDGESGSSNQPHPDREDRQDRQQRQEPQERREAEIQETLQ